MTVFVVTPELAATVERLGAEGEAWLARLPGIVEGCERRWGATVGPPFQPGGFVSYAAPATLEDGTEAVLKISYPEWETINEGAALRFYDGDGAARLLAEAPEQTALLLERLRPGTSLWSLRDEDEANAIAAGVLRRLWRPVAQDGDHPFELLADHAARWSVSVREELERPVPTSLSAVVAEASAVFAEYPASMGETVLLHQDFHQGNVLSAQREPWLAIDPKPLVGEREFDVASLLRDRREELPADPDPARRVRRRFDQLTEALEVDRERTRGWAIAQTVELGLWSLGSEANRMDVDRELACAELIAAIKL